MYIIYSYTNTPTPRAKENRPMETNGDPSLFGQEDEITPANAKLDVVKAEFVETESLSWEELFEGFDRLRAITYSSGIDFICKLLKMFERAEIIFGFEGVMAYTLSGIEDLEVHKSWEWIIMNLDKASEFFGINFKKRFF
jgi:hypothetical protein